MATVTITGNTVRDGSARPDNRPWKHRAAVYQDGGSGSVITPGEDWTVVRPVAGRLVLEVEAGIVLDLMNPDKKTYRVTTPLVDDGLWDVIEAGVAYSPETSQDQLAAAVGQYIEEHSSDWVVALSKNEDGFYVMGPGAVFVKNADGFYELTGA